ncbi:MAG TPA: magnesium transporter [Clostridiales bacterium]|nr:magnesium transporter [Clostridiales bacterium]
MAGHNVTIENTIKALTDGRKYSTIKDILVTMNGADIAAVFEEISKDKIPLLFRLLPKKLAAETFVEMSTDLQELLIQGFSNAELREVIEELYVDDVADLIDEMPANVVKRILDHADPEMRRDINEILKYPENSAGSIMTTEYISLKPNMTIDEALRRIRETAVDKETVYTCYVTENRKLIGVVTLKEILLVKDDNTRISDIMNPNVISVHTTDEREEVAKQLSKYNFIAMPVIDNEGMLVGIITFDDAMDVIEKETTEDIEKMAAILPSEKGYLQSKAIDIYKQRIPWLLLLMVSATFTGMIISMFEAALAAQVVLTAFIPMLMDTGGNAGSQASVTVIRALSLGNVSFRDLPKVIWKEFRAAILSGLSLAAVCFFKILLIDRLFLGNKDVTLLVSAVVCATLAVTVIAAKIIGGTLPMLAEKLGFDPAVMSSPFITTIIDAISLLVYFGFASLLLFR